jgi:hypothetical protein
VRHAESSPSTALLCILPDIPSRVVEDSRQRTILTTRSGKRRAAHLVCRSIELSHSDSNCRSISQWSRATGPANLLRVGRPERRKTTTAVTHDVIGRVLNRMTTAATINDLSGLDCHIADPARFRCATQGQPRPSEVHRFSRPIKLYFSCVNTAWVLQCLFGWPLGNSNKRRLKQRYAGWQLRGPMVLRHVTIPVGFGTSNRCSPNRP